MKNKLFTALFAVLLSVILIITFISPKQELSISERRKLKTFPTFSIDSFAKGDFMKALDAYALDHFAFRDRFRSLKAFVTFDVFNRLDNNDIYRYKDHVLKLEYPLDTKSIDHLTTYLNNLTERYLENCTVYLSVIPDKNYFVPKDEGFPSLDYDALFSQVSINLKNITYIDITNVLVLDDYYTTDTHWKQENLDKVVLKLQDSMGMQTDFSSIKYSNKKYTPFYGVYYGQSALNVATDELIYKTNDTISQAIVTNFENKNDTSNSGIYAEEKLGKTDSYDVFLSGSTPLITISNPTNSTGKELIIFRDSFASSLTPLLIEEYSKITLVDLRYMSQDLLTEYINFDHQDVLFLYSTLIINHSNLLK